MSQVEHSDAFPSVDEWRVKWEGEKASKMGVASHPADQPSDQPIAIAVDPIESGPTESGPTESGPTDLPGTSIPVNLPSRADVAALAVAEVSVRFGGVLALNNVNLMVQPGTVTGLIGPNGAGKTTLFHVISGLQTPDRGTVRFFDTDVTSMKPHLRARLGLARTFQRLELFGTLSAGENVQVGLESTVRWWQWRHLRTTFPWKRGPLSAGGESPDVDDPGGPGALAVATSDRLLSGVGLDGRSREQASAMPTGLARMVELARGLAIGPKLLLLDEPGSGLDESESQALGDLLVGLAAKGMAVLLVEHDMELVMRICHQIYVLDFGEIIATGVPDEIRANPAVQAAYLGASPSDESVGAVRASARPPSAHGGLVR